MVSLDSSFPLTGSTEEVIPVELITSVEGVAETGGEGSAVETVV